MSDSPLKAQLTEAMKTAMRARDKARLGAIRLALSEIKRVEVDERIEVDDARTISILTRMIKQRRDSEQQYRDANRTDLADQEAFEIGVLEEFMPAQLSESDIQTHIEEALNTTGASGPSDMGKVMGMLKGKLAGQADMGLVSKLVKARLAP